MTEEVLSSVIVAVSAVVTAGATVVLAVLSRGTWHLYQLERQTRHAQAGKAAVSILREAASIREQLKRFGPAELGSSPDHVAVVTRIITRRTEWLYNRLHALDALRNSTELGPKAVAHLDVGYEVLLDAMGYWEEIVEVVGRADSEAYSADREIVMAHLSAVAGALSRAYSSIPSEVRAWGVGEAEYSEYYDAAAEESAGAFPVAHRYLRTSRALSETPSSVRPV